MHGKVLTPYLWPRSTDLAS